MQCPIINDNYDTITLAHGGGGKLTHNLITNVFMPAFSNSLLAQAHDSTVLPKSDYELVMTTDSYVINPVFFAGGDIGKLAVCGTINDLVMAGSKPLYLSAGFIIEEGFAINDLQKICQSMASIASENNVAIVCGDTKVIERANKSSNIYINTTGIGEKANAQHIHPDSIQAGDAIILSGDVGRHSIAIMSEREGLSFEAEIASDCASLKNEIEAVIDNESCKVHCLRDLTRGGLATSCIELAEASCKNLIINEDAIPVENNVHAACELLGLDPLYCANEGRFVLICPPEHVDEILNTLKQHGNSQYATVIGSVENSSSNAGVILKTSLGTKTRLRKQSGEQLPRIC